MFQPLIPKRNKSSKTTTTTTTTTSLQQHQKFATEANDGKPRFPSLFASSEVFKLGFNKNHSQLLKP